MANNIKSTNLPLILTGRGVKPTVPSNIRAVFGDDDFDVTSDLMVGQQAYNVDDDIWYYRNKKGISTLAAFHKAIISPNGKVYVPADAAIARFISIAVDNNDRGKVFWFNNETEAFESKVDLLGDYDDGLFFTIEESLNDIIVMRLNNDGQYTKLIGVNNDGSLTDTSSLIVPNSSTAIHYVYVPEGIIALSQNKGQYQLTFNPETDNVVYNIGPANSSMAGYAIEKLDEQWFVIHEETEGYGLVPIYLVKWVDPKNSDPEHISYTYTSSDSQPFRLLRTIPGSTEYYDINADYPLLPGLYEDIDGFKHVVFNGDPEMYSVNELINLNDNMYTVRGLVDSSTRKILVCSYGEDYSTCFFDVDTQEFIEPTYNEPYATLDEYRYSTYNNVHELSDGSFIAKVDDYVFISQDLRSWTMIIGTTYHAIP